MARKQKQTNAAVELLKTLLGGLVEAAEDGDEDAVAILDDAGLSFDGGSDDDSGEEEDEDEGSEYDDMSLAELKKECKSRGIKVPRSADEDTLIELLEEDDDGDDEDDDEDRK